LRKELNPSEDQKKDNGAPRDFDENYVDEVFFR
jgi:hypothetical protein